MPIMKREETEEEVYYFGSQEARGTLSYPRIKGVLHGSTQLANSVVLKPTSLLQTDPRLTPTCMPPSHSASPESPDWRNLHEMFRVGFAGGDRGESIASVFDIPSGDSVLSPVIPELNTCISFWEIFVFNFENITIEQLC